MPHLRFRAVSQENVLELSNQMILELSKITNAPVENFTVEHLPTLFFSQGRKVDSDPFCEVFWFDRGQTLQDEAAKIITKYLKKIYPQKDCIVIFNVLAKSAYYENGEHF